MVFSLVSQISTTSGLCFSKSFVSEALSSFKIIEFTLISKIFSPCNVTFWCWIGVSVHLKLDV